MRAAHAALLSFFAGAASFWIPDVVAFAVIPDRARWIAMTALCPAGALCFYAWLRRRRVGDDLGPSSALYQLLGIWMLAPWFMFLASRLGPGTKMAMETGDYGFLLLASILPIWTPQASAEQGSGWALLLVTMALLVCHFRKESGRWLLPIRSFRRRAR
jgi:hypothetical protein